MAERHGQVLSDIIHAVLAEANVIGPERMHEVRRMASLAKNRRQGSTGYSPRTLIDGLDERSITSGLDHYWAQ